MGYSPSVDVDAIAETMRASVNAWKNQGYCVIIDPTQTIRSTNIQAGTSSTFPIPLGSGPCRIQPIKADLTERNQTNDTTGRTTQFWLDYPKDQTIPDIRPGFEIVVTNGGNDPYLVNYQYPVTGAMNSSMAWQRTIFTNVNLEAKPIYNWSFLLGQITNQNGVNILVEYLDSNSVWQPYINEVTSTNEYHIPMFLGGSYRITYSKTGFVSQTVSVPSLLLHDDTPMSDITLAPV